jgi:hypothetical protein
MGGWKSILHMLRGVWGGQTSPPSTPVPGPYRVVSRQVFQPGAVAAQVIQPGAVAGQIGGQP